MSLVPKCLEPKWLRRGLALPVLSLPPGTTPPHPALLIYIHRVFFVIQIHLKYPHGLLCVFKTSATQETRDRQDKRQTRDRQHKTRQATDKTKDRQDKRQARDRQDKTIQEVDKPGDIQDKSQDKTRDRQDKTRQDKTSD